jgi:hypothetical protein
MLRRCHTVARGVELYTGRLPHNALPGVGLAVALSVAGCTDVDDRATAWGYLSPAIFQPTCATPSCHSRGAAVSGLDFSDPDRGYASLTALTVRIEQPPAADGGTTGDGGTVTVPRQLVTAFSPGQSRVIDMLRARGAPRMPPDLPLTEADIALIEAWILDGARRTPAGAPAGVASDGGADGP